MPRAAHPARVAHLLPAAVSGNEVDPGFHYVL